MEKLLNLLCIIVFLGFASSQYKDEPCTTKDSNIGECRYIADCPSAASVKAKDLRRFNRCTFDGFKSLICCPETANVAVKTTPASDNINADFYFKPDTIATAPKPNIVTINRLNVRPAIKACTDLLDSNLEGVRPLILDGEVVNQGDFPHMAALGYETDTGLQFNCGGTLISSRYVVTAAHCVRTVDRLRPSIVRLGSVLLEDNIGENINIEETIVHPQYNRSILYNDLALLKLERNVEFSGDLHPACLNTEPANPSGKFIITGWGTTDIKRDSKSSVLLKASISPIENARCNITFTRPEDKKKLPLGIRSSQLCAKDTVGRSDTCQGDSGGPLQLLRPNTDNFYTLYGVTSFGRICGTDNPAVYTRISSYLDWIESVVWPPAA